MNIVSAKPIPTSSTLNSFVYSDYVRDPGIEVVWTKIALSHEAIYCAESYQWLESDHPGQWWTQYPILITPFICDY